MKKIIVAVRQALSLIALLITANASQALIIEQTLSFDNDGVSAVLFPSSNSNVGTGAEKKLVKIFNGFDSVSGTLTSARVTFDTVFRLAGSFGVVDPESNCFLCEDNVNGTGTIGNAVGLQIFANALIAEQADGKTSAVGCNDDDGACLRSFDPGLQAFSGLLFESSDVAVLNQFIDDTIYIHTNNRVWAKVDNCYDSEDLCNASASSGFSGTITVSYYYDAPVSASVPEPSSLALIGLGFAGLRLARRRKSVQ